MPLNPQTTGVQLPGPAPKWRRVWAVAKVLWANRKAEIAAGAVLVDVAQQLIRAATGH